jgi:hypothetical protein
MFSLKVYFNGEAKECRLKVQTMNELKSKIEEERGIQRLTETEFRNVSETVNHSSQNGIQVTIEKKESKWAKYLTEDE